MDLTNLGPQSVQSVPRAHAMNFELGPESSQLPSLAYLHVSEQIFRPDGGDSVAAKVPLSGMAATDVLLIVFASAVALGRGPQSLQSDPSAQAEYLDPRPPSSQDPSLAYLQVSVHVVSLF